jgi:uncharacterized membrane protein YraQ (UPF0718 family)
MNMLNTFLTTKQQRIVLSFVILAGLAFQTVYSLDIPNQIQDTITLALGILYEALPFVFLGVCISIVVQQYVSQDRLIKILPKKSWLRRPVLSMCGTFLPVCECGNVPLARGLMAKGLRPAEVMTFLFAAPIINPVTIYTTTQAFPADPSIVIVRVIAAFIIANLIGTIFAKRIDTELLTNKFQNYCSSHGAIEKKSSSFGEKIRHYAKSFVEEVSLLMPALIGGSIIAGIIQTTLPRNILQTISSEPILAILALILLAFVISICANVDAFFALSLSSVFPASAIVAFLVFGPMIDIKMLALLKTTFKTHVLIYISVFVFMSSLLTGLVVQYAL